MGMFDGLIDAVNKEYDRRVKRSSEIIEYGMKHGHGHGHHDHATDDLATDDHGAHGAKAHEPEEREDEGAEIMNVPPGTQVRGSFRPTSHEEH